MKAKLLKDTGRQRFYELSEHIVKGRDMFGDINIIDSMKAGFERIKDEYKESLAPYFLDKREIRIVCVSDAITHIERLVFPAYPFEGGYRIWVANIDGKHTMKTGGGDPNSVYADEVYLRHLAILNGLKWEGLS